MAPIKKGIIRRTIYFISGASLAGLRFERKKKTKGKMEFFCKKGNDM
jgi:hypothetical protein